MHKSITLFKISFLTFTFWLFTFAVSLAQESKVAKIGSLQTTSSNMPNAPQAEQGDVKITDGTNTLIRITDEGTFGAIEIKPGVPDVNTNKLYNKNGILSYDGNPVHKNDDWAVSGNSLHSIPSGNVGIGTNSPTEKLEVVGKIKSSELQVITGATDGHVLTSDANGNATWQASSGGSGTTYSVGDLAHGGYIIEVTPDGKHGIVATLQDQSTGVSWYMANDVLSDEANHEASGKNYKDWRLPTKRELNLIYNLRASIGGFSSASYWSSTESDSTNAWILQFSNSGQGGVPKAGNIYHIRAVRVF